MDPSSMLKLVNYSEDEETSEEEPIIQNEDFVSDSEGLLNLFTDSATNITQNTEILVQTSVEQTNDKETPSFSGSCKEVGEEDLPRLEELADQNQPETTYSPKNLSKYVAEYAETIIETSLQPTQEEETPSYSGWYKETDEENQSRDEEYRQESTGEHESVTSAIHPEMLLPSNSSGDRAHAKKRVYALKNEQLTPEMEKFLDDVRDFFIATINLERYGKAVDEQTMIKVKERLRCFLGYVTNDVRKEPVRDYNVFLDEGLIQSYLTYLQNVRRIKAATIACHANSLLYVLKFIHKEHTATKFHGIAIISKLKSTATVLQKQGELERPKTTEQLKAMNKWLSWQQILDAFEAQRERFEMATGIEKSSALKDLLIMAVYSHIPPSRALEIRTLKVFNPRGEDGPSGTFVLNHHQGENILVKESSGAITLHIQDFKTKKSHGYDQVKIEVGTELNKLLDVYLAKHRETLLKKNSHNFVFMNSHGTPFTSSCFTKHLQGIFYKLTGQRISVNTLRSSFVTYAYSTSNCNDSLKDSIASALRHSRRQAERVYDKRTMIQKKEKALAFTQQLAESTQSDEASSSSGQEDESSSNSGQEEDDDNNLNEFPLGSFVGLVQEGSTLDCPMILIGRVNGFTKKGLVRLLHYKHCKGKNYALSLDGEKWTEKLNSLVAVQMKPSNKIPEQFTLTTSLKSIHKQVLD